MPTKSTVNTRSLTKRNFSLNSNKPSFLKTLEKNDDFGLEIKLNIDGNKEKINSPFGGLVSIVLKVLILLYFG